MRYRVTEAQVNEAVRLARLLNPAEYRKSKRSNELDSHFCDSANLPIGNSLDVLIRILIKYCVSQQLGLSPAKVLALVRKNVFLDAALMDDFFNYKTRDADNKAYYEVIVLSCMKETSL